MGISTNIACLWPFNLVNLNETLQAPLVVTSFCRYKGEVLNAVLAANPLDRILLDSSQSKSVSYDRVRNTLAYSCPSVHVHVTVSL